MTQTTLRARAARCGGACAILLASASLAFGQTGSAAQKPEEKQPASASQTRQAEGQPMTIAVDELQAHPEKYSRKQVTVEAEVQDVLGPRLLTIDSREALELDGDLLVFIRAPFAGLVSERARVTVTGTVQPLVKADVERELQWLDPDTAGLVAVDFEKRPMIVATSIKSDRGVELAVEVMPMSQQASSGQPSQPMPRGTTGANPESGSTAASGSTATSGGRGAAVTDISRLAGATDAALVGREVRLTNARVVRAADNRSFWVSGVEGRDNVLVVPSDPAKVTIEEGGSVSISGVVLQMPQAWQDKFSTTQGTNEEIYVFASNVQSGQSGR